MEIKALSARFPFLTMGAAPAVNGLGIGQPLIFSAAMPIGRNQPQ
jgi:hypothetical protein